MTEPTSPAPLSPEQEAALHRVAAAAPDPATAALRAERERYAELLRELIDLVAVTHRYPIQGGHDNLGAGLACAGCALADRARAALAAAPAEGSDH
ncbi:hypothetical protein [Streptomyces sp. NPDC005322]|uniref:hypothetical protein n=1 Tax=Streptomyces sp. NPDC005322 TaxID=3157032 RepID=UPI0033BF44E4